MTSKWTVKCVICFVIELRWNEVSDYVLFLRAKFTSLEDISVRIKEGCTTHLPWPKGICSKCQPSAVILNRQVYRHVDNVMFENPNIVERFLSYWRASGHQRMGFLYGRYEDHTDVPLGIRLVSAVLK